MILHLFVRDYVDAKIESDGDVGDYDNVFAIMLGAAGFVNPNNEYPLIKSVEVGWAATRSVCEQNYYCCCFVLEF